MSLQEELQQLSTTGAANSASALINGLTEYIRNAARRGERSYKHYDQKFGNTHISMIVLNHFKNENISAIIKQEEQIVNNPWIIDFVPVRGCPKSEIKYYIELSW